MLYRIRHWIAIGLIVGVVLSLVWVIPASFSLTANLSSQNYGPPVEPPSPLTSRPPKLFCEAAFLQDNSTSEKLYGKDEYTVRPIASITKLLTALTFLDFKVSWDKSYTLDTFDANNASRSSLRAGDTYRVGDLFHASLMASDNRATRAIARSTGIPIDSFIHLMNKKADDLGLLSIKVDEVTGLSENNVSSAADCARLLNIAAENQTIQDIMQTREYTFSPLNRRRLLTMGNTNRLLYSPWQVEGGKTGHIDEAGWCFVARAEDRGHDLTVVVLGANSNMQRFKQATKLLQWAFTELEKGPSRSSKKS